MLQKQSISRDQIFLIIIAIGAVALFVIIFSLLSDGRIDTLTSFLPGRAAAGELSTNDSVHYAASARWTGPAGQYVNLYGSTAWVRAGLSPAMQVEADRLTVAAGELFNLYGSSVRASNSLTPAQKVEAQRLKGMAGEYFNLYGTTIP